MRTVAANVQDLTIWNRSMAVALGKAENGTGAEDMYFIERLRRSAAVLGYSLTHCKKPPDPNEQEKPAAAKAFEQAVEVGRLSRNPKDLNYAGRYMYMGGYETGEAMFKNINTRAYDV